MVRRLKEIFGGVCERNASGKYRSVFNTIGNDLLRSPDSLPNRLSTVTSYKTGTDVSYSLALKGSDIDTAGEED